MMGISIKNTKVRRDMEREKRVDRWMEWNGMGKETPCQVRAPPPPFCLLCAPRPLILTVPAGPGRSTLFFALALSLSFPSLSLFPPPLFFFQVVTIDPKNANKTALLEQLHAAKAALKADLTSLPIEKKEKVPVPTAGPT